MFYPSKRLCEAEPEWGPFDSFHFIVSREVFGTLNLLGQSRLFEILKMFYPPKGLCEVEPEWGPFDSFHFIVSKEGYLTPSIYWG